LIQQVLGFLSVAVHIPFIGLLGGNDLFPGLLAEPLRGGEVRMARTGDILFACCAIATPPISNDAPRTAAKRRVLIIGAILRRGRLRKDNS
jgi:hypothetical protein